uniref:BAR domain-containing protein n=1 Tax=Caenorhabditis japonica TaxID=281687 RepID=A0A8R1DLF3_CAEJA
MIKEDVNTTEVVRELFEEAKPYEKYRLQFKRVYTQFLSNVGFDENDFKSKRSEIKCVALHQNLILANTMKGQEAFLTEIRPIFEAAIRAETDTYHQNKKQLQTLYDFYNNQFEKEKAEFETLGPKLEAFQKNKPTLPDKIQEMDTIYARFMELQKTLKTKLQPDLATIQSTHLKVIRDVLDIYQKYHEQLVTVFEPCAQIAVKKKDPPAQ